MMFVLIISMFLSGEKASIFRMWLLFENHSFEEIVAFHTQSQMSARLHVNNFYVEFLPLLNCCA